MTQMLTYAKSTIVPIDFVNCRTARVSIQGHFLMLGHLKIIYVSNYYYFYIVSKSILRRIWYILTLLDVKLFIHFLTMVLYHFAMHKFFFLLSLHTNDVLFSISFFLMLYFNVVVQPKFLFSGSSGRYFNLYKSKKGTYHERQSFKGWNYYTFYLYLYFK